MPDPTSSSSLSKCMEPEPECKRGLEARCNTNRKQPPAGRIRDWCGAVWCLPLPLVVSRGSVAASAPHLMSCSLRQSSSPPLSMSAISAKPMAVRCCVRMAWIRFVEQWRGCRPWSQLPTATSRPGQAMTQPQQPHGHLEPAFCEFGYCY
jgi:hypothetical protein